jgi:hypothetical protein
VDGGPRESGVVERPTAPSLASGTRRPCCASSRLSWVGLGAMRSWCSIVHASKVKKNQGAAWDGECAARPC